MPTPRNLTLTASFAALLAAAPAMAQQNETQSGSEQQQTQQQQGQNQDSTGEQDQQQTGTQGATDEEMPEAATGEGGMSDLAEVDTPPGEIGGNTVVLDIEGFSQAIYERGFRQGYLRGIADARERLVSELERSRAMRQGMAAQQGRSAMGGQEVDPANPQGQARAGGQASGRTGDAMTGGDERMSGGPSGMGERGSIIVLPPGVTPQMLIERLMEMNDAAQDG